MQCQAPSAQAARGKSFYTWNRHQGWDRENACKEVMIGILLRKWSLVFLTNSTAQWKRFLASLLKKSYEVVLLLMLLFCLVSKTGAGRKILSSEISLHSLLKPVITGDRHVYTSSSIFTGGECEIISSTNSDLHGEAIHVMYTLSSLGPAFQNSW